MTLSDADVVADVRGGNRDAFSHLVERYQRRVFGLVLMVVRNPAVAEDVAQDAFVRAFTHLDAYETHRPFYPWIATIAVRLAQNALRSQGRTGQHETAVESAVLFDTAADALDDLIDDEQARQVWRAAAALPSGERTVVCLYYRDDLSVGEIARALGVSTGTVKTLLFRARRHLRERFERRD